MSIYGKSQQLAAANDRLISSNKSMHTTTLSAEKQAVSRSAAYYQTVAAPDKDAIVVYLYTDQGEVGVTATQYGQLMLAQYTPLPTFRFAQYFRDYRRDHVLSELTAALKRGMDEISCAYIDHQEKLYDLLPVMSDVVLKKEHLDTAEDLKLKEHMQELIASKQYPFLTQWFNEMATAFCNRYGLYDTPPELLQAANGKAMLDVGGYIGDTLVVFRSILPKSELYAFEPDSNNFQNLLNTIADMERHEQVHAYNCGVGASKGKLKLHHSSFGMAAGTMLEVPLATDDEEVDIITIDDFVAEHKLQVGLIKVDVEGFEPDVIQGALQTIKKQKPILVIAVYHSAKEYYELKPFLESLNLGYSFRLRRSCFCNPLCELVLIALPNS